MSLRALTLLFFVAVSGVSAIAESTACTTPVIIIPDGRITESTILPSTTFWYGIYALTGHSYSVEFESAADNYVNNAKVVLSGLVVFAPSDLLTACKGSSSVTLTQNAAYAPAIKKNGNGMGIRASFTAQTAGLYLITLQNMGNQGSYSFRAVDTTLVNPRWSTYGGYFTHWGLLNVSDMPIAGVFTVFDFSGKPLASSQLSLAPGAEQFHTSLPNDMNLAPSTAGYATFSHNGPMDAIIGDSYMVSGNGAIIYVSRFERPAR